jgi:hypothetical protein
MTLSEARDLADFVAGLPGTESASVKPARRGGYRLIVRMVGEPPRIYSNHRTAFEAYCGSLEEAQP